jgi:hypothetical protein
LFKKPLADVTNPSLHAVKLGLTVMATSHMGAVALGEKTLTTP